jgi:uncharacterized protein (DUF433 family)
VIEYAMRNISINPNICHGKPTVAGTRIMVAQVLDLLEAGKTPQQIVSDYFPDLSDEDVRACIRFAKQLVENEEIEVVRETVVI